jgi:hypothetical protein
MGRGRQRALTGARPLEIGTFVLGLLAGLPFAVIFAAAQRIRPDAPGAATAALSAIALIPLRTARV